MENMDVMLGADKRTIKLGGKEYIVAPMGPFLLGEIVSHIKEVRRKQIALNARDVGVTDLAEVYKLTKAPLTESELNDYMEQPEIARMLIWYSLRVYQPELSLDDLGKLITTENLPVVVSEITGAQEVKNAGAPKASL